MSNRFVILAFRVADGPDSKPTPEPAPKLANDTSSPNLNSNQPSLAHPFIKPEKLNRAPAVTDCVSSNRPQMPQIEAYKQDGHFVGHPCHSYPYS